MYNKVDSYADLNTMDLCEKQFQIQRDLLKEHYKSLDEGLSAIGNVLSDLKNTNYMLLQNAFDWHKAVKMEMTEKDRVIHQLKVQLGQHNCVQPRFSLSNKQWEPNSQRNQLNNALGERSGQDEKRSNYYHNSYKKDNRACLEKPRWPPHRRRSCNERAEAYWSCNERPEAHRTSERWARHSNRDGRYAERLYLIDNSGRKEYVDSADSEEHNQQAKHEKERKKYIRIEEYRNKNIDNIKSSNKEPHITVEIPTENKSSTVSKRPITPTPMFEFDENPPGCLASFSPTTSIDDIENANDAKSLVSEENLPLSCSTSKTPRKNDVENQIVANKTTINEAKNQLSRAISDKSDIKLQQKGNYVENREQETKAETQQKTKNVQIEDTIKSKKSIDNTNHDANTSTSKENLKKIEESTTDKKSTIKTKDSHELTNESGKLKTYRIPRKTDETVKDNIKNKGHLFSPTERNRKNNISNSEKKRCKAKLNFDKNETKESLKRKSLTKSEDCVRDDKIIHTRDIISGIQSKADCLKPELDDIANSKNSEIIGIAKESFAKNLQNTNNFKTNEKSEQTTQNLTNPSIISNENIARRQSEETLETISTSHPVKEKKTKIHEHSPHKSLKHGEVKNSLKKPAKLKEILDNTDNTRNTLVVQIEKIRMQANEFVDNTDISCGRIIYSESKQLKNSDIDAEKSSKPMKPQQHENSCENDSCKKEKRKGQKSKDGSIKKTAPRKRRNTIYEELEKSQEKSNIRVLRSATKQAQVPKSNICNEESESRGSIESSSTMHLSANGEIPVLHLSENERYLGESRHILEEDLHLSFDQSNDELNSPDIDKNKNLSTPTINSNTNTSDTKCSSSPVHKRRRLIFSMID